MSAPVEIKGEGSNTAKVLDDALLVSVLPFPPLDVPNQILPFVSFLTVEGDKVTGDLRIDGSSDPIDCFVGPPVEGDIYITTANILVSDSGTVALNRFGGIQGGLTNGIDLFVETENERFIVAGGMRSNFDMIRIGTLTQGTGGKNDAYQLSNTNSANEDGYNPILDFTKVTPIGIRLRKNSLDKLGIIVRDDLTSLGTFNITVTGFLRR